MRRNSSLGPSPDGLLDPSARRDGVSEPLDVDVAAHRVASGLASDVQPIPADECFRLGPGGFAVVEHMPAGRGERLLAYLQDCLLLETDRGIPRYASPLRELDTALAHGLEITDAGVQSSALVAQFAPDTNVLRVAWAGACGLIVVRGQELVFRSFQRQSPQEGLEKAFKQFADDDSPQSATDQVTSNSSHYRPSVMNTAVADRHWDATALDSCVQSAFVELEDGDLVLGGSQSFFANLGENQIISFVRPVPDPHDKTLGIANGTCLGSFRTDDVTFISYYLSHLAHNFATSDTAKPLMVYPFPPSPVLEDVIVIAAACSFAV